VLPFCLARDAAPFGPPRVTRGLIPLAGVSLSPGPARYPCREPNMDRLNRYNSELNLAVWAALLVVALLLGR